MKRRSSPARCLLLALVLALATLGAPQVASAQDDDTDLDEIDGRVRGYENAAAIIPESGTALTYMALILLMAVAIGVMFKTSRRTHLD